MPTNIIKLTVLTTGLITGLLSTEIVSAQSTDEIVVEGKYLYTDQVNALKTPRGLYGCVGRTGRGLWTCKFG